MEWILDHWPSMVLVVEGLFKAGMICFILTRRQMRPATALSWIVVMFALPAVGIVAYLLVGEVRLGRGRIRRHRVILDRINTRGNLEARPEHQYKFPWVPVQYQPVANLAESVAGNAPRAGNLLELMGDPDLFIEKLIEDIDRAERHCHLLSYIYLTDHSSQRVGDALIRAVKRGVKCRLLADSVGSKYFLRSDLCRKMREAGVQVVEALPARALRILLARVDLRNHRKIAVIDDSIGYMGSQNIADPEFAIKRKYAPWVDCMVRIDGPAARDLQVLFVEDWYLDTDEALTDLLEVNIRAHDSGVPVQIMGTGPNSNNEGLRQLITTTFYAAREELILTTPYFVPDEATMLALLGAAQRGVQTTLVVPARNDSPFVAAASRSFYDAMLRSNVSIMEFTGGLLHAKTIAIDRDLAVVSSANLDRRSFELNFEISMVVYDSNFASELRFLQKTYMNTARAVQRSDWRNRGWPTKLVQNAAGLFSPLL